MKDFIKEKPVRWESLFKNTEEFMNFIITGDKKKTWFETPKIELRDKKIPF